MEEEYFEQHWLFAGGNMKPDIKIKYDGEFPNLCSGHLEVWVNDKYYDFGNHILTSGGYVHFDDNWNETVGHGEWSVDEYPEDFPEELKGKLLAVVNKEIPWGCCGGCV